MRLNACLARAGVASRRKADELIKAGRVTVNGEPGQLNTFVGADDDVRLDGEAAREAAARLRAAAQAGRRRHDRARSAGPADGRRLVAHPARVVPVGRLDADTTGALLLTNDGDLAHRLAHPRYEIDKVYEIESRTSRPTRPGAARATASSSTTARRAPAARRRLGAARIELTIHEGRKHQVKRMLRGGGPPRPATPPQRYAATPRPRRRAGASSSRARWSARA